ncbi:MAG: RNA-binding protein [Cytophagales bacterium]|nr:RNA-binding protein [Cytophagales bacterium]MDW8383204.1 RNA-binding protein [Flammeovirgaceae bacterium]
MNIYVANIAFSTKESELEKIFSEYGQVTSVKIIKDRETGKSKGFGFVEMEDERNAAKAVSSIDGRILNGRELRVKKAFPRPSTR